MTDEYAARSTAVPSSGVEDRDRVDQALQSTLCRLQRQLQAVGEISQAEELLAGDVDGLAHKVTELAARAIGCERVNVWLFDADEANLCCIDLYEATPARHSAGLLLAEREYGNEFQALKSSKYVAADHPLTDPRTAGYVATYVKPLRITSMLDTVIQISGKNLGLLCFEHVDTPHHWEQDEISFAGQLADKLGLALIGRMRRRAEDELRASESRFQTIFDAVNDMVFVYDIGIGAFTDVNARATELFGYTREEILRDGVGKFSVGVAPYTRADALARLAATSAGETRPFEWHFKSREGRTFWGEVSLRRTTFGTREVVLGTVRDISERKTREEALQASAAALEEAQHLAGLGSWSWDPRSDRVTWSAELYRIFERDPRGPAPPVAEQSRLFTPRSYATLVAALRRSVADGAPYALDLEFVGEDGRQGWMLARGEAERGDDGVVECLRGTALDITERKHAEDELRRVQEALNEAQAVAHVGSWQLELAKSRLTFSDEIYRILGIDRATFSGSYDALLSRVHSDDRMMVGAAYSQSVADRVPFDVEHRIVRDDGTMRIVRQRGQTFYRADDEPLRTIGTVQDITEQKEAEAALIQERDFSAALTDSLPGLLVLIDDRGRFVRWNENLSNLTRLSNAQLDGLDALAIVVESDRESARAKVQEAFRHGLGETEIGVLSAGGDARIIHWNGRKITREGSTYLLAVGIDVTAARAAEMQLRTSEERFRAVSETAQDGIIMIDDAGLIAYWNGAAERILGYTVQEAMGRNVHEWLTPTRYREKAYAGMREFAATGRGDVLDKTTELAAIRKDGTEIPVELSLAGIWLGTQRHAIGILRDITERKLAADRIRIMARQDVLTGLDNRAVFVAALEHEIARAQRGVASFAVLYLDLDHFKDVNDTLGHPVGDLLLQAIAQRLQESIRTTDTVARFGGDEFAIIVADIREPSDAAVLADKLLKAIGEPFSIQGNEIRTGTSVGIAVYGQETSDPEELLSHADVALYRAKSEGRGTYRFFTDTMDTEVRARVTLVAELRTAIESGQLFLVYQPQVDVETGRIIGLEALVRWRHPNRGPVWPCEFIPVAEKSGLVVALGHWVLHEACRQTKEWLDAGVAPPLIAVNVSGLQFKTPHELENDIAGTLAETSLPPELLEIELTESVLMEASTEHHDVLARLRKLGLRIAIDDFGTGYSSLSHLSRLPINRIKIAQSFIPDLTRRSGNAAVVKSAIGLAHELGLDVMVEGVETVEQLEMIRSWGARKVQGFYFSRPLPADEVPAVLRAGRIPPPRAAHATVEANHPL